MNCIFCSRILGNTGALSLHTRYCKENPDCEIKIKPINAGFKKGNIPWNNGLINDERSKRTLETREKISKKATGKAVTLEKEIERKFKIKEKSQNNGGYRQGSGRGKKGWYKNFFCDSSWELAYVIYCLDHDIDIKRNTERRTYIWKNKDKNYIPDFIVNDQLIEIKGYKTEQWEAKLSANPDVKVLYKEDLKDIFAYVIGKYGKNYIELYGR